MPIVDIETEKERERERILEKENTSVLFNRYAALRCRSSRGKRSGEKKKREDRHDTVKEELTSAAGEA